MPDLASQRELPVVLLVDDDMISREVTAVLLTMNGYPVHSAESGERAMEMLAEATVQPGLVLMDAQMPGLSGTELIEKLRSACPRAAIYLISGSAVGADLLKAADGLLTKPFNAVALRKLMEGPVGQAPRSDFDPQEPVLSAEILEQLRQLMPESAVREIYAAVVADLRRQAEALEKAIASNDRAEIGRIGHSIKGGCGMAGVLQAARVGALLEQEAMRPDDDPLENSRVLLQDLYTAAQGLQRILDAELQA